MSIVDNFSKLELIFTTEEAQFYYSSKKSLERALNIAVRKGYIKRIKRNYYAVVDLATGEPYANKFQIASKLSEDAVVSHISAFQYHGLFNQVSYDIHYTTFNRIRDIIFEENNYIRHSPGIIDNSVGIVEDKWNSIRVTDIERTILDSVYSINKIAGIDEIIEVFGMLAELDEENMMAHLSVCKVNKAFHQRLGFLLEEFSGLTIGSHLMACLLDNKGGSPKYLTPITETQKGKTTYVKKWNLVVPRNLLSMKGD